MIEHVDFAAIEVRRQKESAIEQGETLVNRTAGGVIKVYACRIAGPIPTRKDAVFGVKNEQCATEVTAVGVGHGAGWATRTAVAVWIFCGSGYGYHEASIFFPLVVIERRGTAVVVGDPEV